MNEFGGEDGRAEDPTMPAFLLGQRVSVESKLDGRIGLRVRCLNPAHGECKKYRSLRMQTDKYGPKAAVYYLTAWLEASHADLPQPHNKWKPSPELIQAVRDRDQAIPHDSPP